MHRYDGTPGMPSGSASTRDDEDTTTTNPPVNLVDELLAPRPQANLARGIVWADILADIAADEQERQLRDAA